LGLPFERLPAVDARRFTPEQAALLDASAYRYKHGKEPVPGELGCYLSHVQAMRQFLASDADFGLIFEDDALVHGSLPAVLHGLMRQPGRWDMAKLSAVHSGTPVRLCEVAPGHHLAVMLTRCTGASAYLVNRRAAQAYTKRMLPMQLPFDIVYDLGWQFGLKVRLVTPTPCTHDDQIASNIAAPRAAMRNFHWTKRMSTYGYRLRIEARRLLYGVTQLLRDKLSR
jgi:glycosyl transferase family 25